MGLGAFGRGGGLFFGTVDIDLGEWTSRMFQIVINDELAFN